MKSNNTEIEGYDYINKKENLNDIFSIGGEEELKSAIDIYGQDLLRYCHNITCDYHDAEEVVQIAFIKAYEKRRSFKPGTSLSAWLYRIAYTTAIDFIRKKKFQQIIFYKDFNKKHDCNENSYISEELREALLKLSPKERALIFSRVLDEKDYGELESIYNASAQTLRKRYERAKKKLLVLLKEDELKYCLGDEIYENR